MSPHASLTLQLIGSATAYEDFTSVGIINVSAVQLALPTVGAPGGPTPTPLSDK
jgi:ABC-2 type transport system ATP-binding protein